MIIPLFSCVRYTSNIVHASTRLCNDTYILKNHTLYAHVHKHKHTQHTRTQISICKCEYTILFMFMHMHKCKVQVTKYDFYFIKTFDFCKTLQPCLCVLKISKYWFHSGKLNFNWRNNRISNYNYTVIWLTEFITLNNENSNDEHNITKTMVHYNVLKKLYYMKIIIIIVYGILHNHTQHYLLTFII